MKKCEKCQIKVDETENLCPVCGSALTEFDENGNVNTGYESTESSGILDVSFTQKLQGVLTRKSLFVATILLTICFAYQVVMCIADITGLLGMLIHGAFAAGTAMLCFSAKKDSFPEKAKTATMILYITSIVFLCVFVLYMAVFAVCAILMFFGTESFNAMLPIFTGLGISQEIIGISFVIGIIFAVAIMLPYYISFVFVTKSLKDGVYGKEITSIKGVGVLRVYSVILLICSVYVIMLTLADPTVILALLPFISLFILTDTLSQFNKVLRLEKFV